MDSFFRHIDLSNLTAVHAFISMKHTGEVETAGLFERLWTEFPQIHVFAPRVNETSGNIDSIPFTLGTKLADSRWKITEPAEGEASDPLELDIVVVPLICFDRRGFRVGYGKGFYDRFLASCRPDCVRAGLSFFPPVDLIDDVHDGDVPLDLAVTPEMVFQPETDSEF